MERVIWAVGEFFWGRFGRKVITKKYRVWWQRFWMAVFFFMFLWGMKLFFEWWNGVVQFLNDVIWG